MAHGPRKAQAIARSYGGGGAIYTRSTFLNYAACFCDYSAYTLVSKLSWEYTSKAWRNSAMRKFWKGIQFYLTYSVQCFTCATNKGDSWEKRVEHDYRFWKQSQCRRFQWPVCPYIYDQSSMTTAISVVWANNQRPWRRGCGKVSITESLDSNVFGTV